MKKIENIFKNFFFTIMMILSMIAWGGSWTSAKIISKMSAPEVIVFWRFFLTFISLIPVIIIRKESLKIDKNSFVLLLFGSVLMVLYNQLFIVGLVIGLAGAGGVLVTTLNPIFTFILSRFIYRSSVNIKDTAGLLLGLIAGVFLLRLWTLNYSEISQSGNLLFLSAAFIWAVITILSQKTQGKVSSIVYSFYIFGISSLLIFFFAYPQGVFAAFKLSFKYWANIVYLSLGATTFATTCYFLCSKKLGAHKASSYTFLVPINAVLISFFILDETPKIATLVGGALAIIGVSIINYKKKKD